MKELQFHFAPSGGSEPSLGMAFKVPAEPERDRTQLSKPTNLIVLSKIQLVFNYMLSQLLQAFDSFLAF